MSRKIRNVLLFCLLLLFVFQMARSSGHFENLYSTVSLRYTWQLSESQVDKALSYASDAASSVYPTFWLEEEREIIASPNILYVTAIGYYGDFSLVWPADFICGAYPGELEKNVCAVSATLAWDLWGSTDIIGQTLELTEKEYTICGVFSSSKEIVVYSAAPDAGFKNVELFGVYEGNERETALEFAEYSGLDTPDWIVYGPTMAWLSRQIAMVPLYVIGVILILRFLRYWKIWKSPRWQIMLTFLGFTLALTLPAILAAIPNWLIPSQWSDFDFWTRLYEDADLRIWEWLSLAPQTKDVEAKICIINNLWMCASSLIIEAILIFQKAAPSNILTKEIPEA